MPRSLSSGLYTLIGTLPVPCSDMRAWGRWMAQSADRDRRVGRDMIGPMMVSTVFLGLDHSHTDEGPPILFETMVFGDGDDSYQTRCTTWDGAEAMHQRAVAVATDMLARAEQSLTVFAHLFEEPKE